MMWMQRLCRCHKRRTRKNEAFVCRQYVVLLFFIVAVYPFYIDAKYLIARGDILNNCKKPCSYMDLLISQNGNRNSYKYLNMAFECPTSLKVYNTLKHDCERIWIKTSLEKVHQLHEQLLKDLYQMSFILLPLYALLFLYEKEAFAYVLLYIGVLVLVTCEHTIANSLISTFRIRCDHHQKYFSRNFYDSFC